VVRFRRSKLLAWKDPQQGASGALVLVTKLGLSKDSKPPQGEGFSESGGGRAPDVMRLSEDSKGEGGQWIKSRKGGWVRYVIKSGGGEGIAPIVALSGVNEEVGKHYCIMCATNLQLMVYQMNTCHKDNNLS
jgi:hypothetical protein